MNDRPVAAGRSPAPRPTGGGPPADKPGTVELYPAIDIIDGRAVRLVQGDFGRRTDYGDPFEAATRLAAEGPPWLHVVDLDAARTGSPVNRDVVAAIARAVGVPVQVGGGVRDELAARALLEAGVARVVVGTAALAQPDLVAALIAHHPGAVAVGLDYRLSASPGPVARREVAVRGWSAGSGTDLTAALASLAEMGVTTVVVTAIDQDGTLSGPDLEGLAVALESGMAVVASGGVGSLTDLQSLACLRRAGRGLTGVVVGRALHDGRFSVREAMAVLQSTGGPGA